MLGFDQEIEPREATIDGVIGKDDYFAGAGRRSGVDEIGRLFRSSR